uniref:Uncharacterized protein n=1 Tax=Haemonchus contortus TaxID=6289 RepID=A0A7I4Y4J5_HAECO
MRLFNRLSYEPVHQPRMKVFTVGLDDKEKSQKADLEKNDSVKTAADVPPMMPVPTPIIVPRAAPKKRFGCGVLSWVVAAFFIVLLCLTISEITYNRQRDQAFLRLKWAELRQRMLGFELLSQAQQQDAQPQVQQPINELPAFPRRNDLVDNVGTTTVASTSVAPEKNVDKTSFEANNDELTSKFDLLRMLLSKMRENAEEMGLSGDMQVHVIEVKPMPNKMPQQSIDDAFGEIAMPRQVFGQRRNSEEENNEFGNHIELPWQFDRESSRPTPWVHPFERMNHWEGPQWGQENRWPQENHIFEALQDMPEEEPQMRITHHYDKDSQTPQRVVTELFGNTAPEVIGHMLGQRNAQAQLQFQQQQQAMMQQQQQQAMMQQQQQPQPWPQPLAQPPAQPFFQPWVPPPPQMWDQPHWDQLPIPPQVPPMVYFFNPVPMPQQQFQQQLPPPPPFQPAITHQNQFPLPVQNQAPIVPQPQPFPVDNNNNANTFNDNAVMTPWYMSGDDQRWQQTWENNNKVDTPFNPHPAAAATPVVENTAAVDQQPVILQPAPGQPTGHDSEGIDGFSKEEKFNVPVDIASDVPPQTMAVAPEKPSQVDVPMVNPWQHAQPEAAEEPMPAAVPQMADPSLGPADDKDFLPLRVSEEVAGQPQSDAETVGAVVVQDTFPKKQDTPFFQIDDPSTFRH